MNPEEKRQYWLKYWREYNKKRWENPEYRQKILEKKKNQYEENKNLRAEKKKKLEQQLFLEKKLTVTFD